MERWATLSPCGLYRYDLGRRWDTTLPTVLWVMLNPSIATDTIDDNTIVAVVEFTKRMGAGTAVVTNLFAWRSTDPKKLREPQVVGQGPIGPQNDSFIHTHQQTAARVMVAWGADPFAAERAKQVLVTADLRRRKLECLGRTKSGAPRHPLRLAHATPVITWREAT